MEEKKPQEKNLKVRSEGLDGHPGVQIVTAEGYIDSYNAADFQQQIGSLVQTGNNHIVVDCMDINYISSAGIGAFMALNKVIEEKNGGFVLINLSRKVLEVFSLLGFVSFFTIRETLDMAVSELIEMKEEAGAAPAAPKAAAGAAPAAPRTATFPVAIACPRCQRKLKAPKPGRFRCSGCKGVLRVTKAGEVVAE